MQHCMQVEVRADSIGGNKCVAASGLQTMLDAVEGSRCAEAGLEGKRGQGGARSKGSRA